MLGHLMLGSLWSMILLATIGDIPKSLALPAGSAGGPSQPMPIKVDVMPHSVTGVCSTEPVSTVSYVVASASPGINGVFLLPESAYKSILSSLANHQLAPIEAYPSLSCNTTDPVTRCRKFTLPDEVLSDRVNHCVMLRNEQSVTVSANVLMSWDNSTDLGFISPPPAPEKAAFRSGSEGSNLVSSANPRVIGLDTSLLLFFSGLVMTMYY